MFYLEDAEDLISGFPPHVFHSRLILVSSIRTPMLIQGRLARTQNNLMHFGWEVIWTHGNQLNTF